MATQAEEPEQERRASTRVRTQRRALIRPRGGAMLAVEASILEVAPFGLLISTRLDVSPGDAVEIEMFPADPMEPSTQVRGIVKHTRGDVMREAGVRLAVDFSPPRDLEYRAEPPAHWQSLRATFNDLTPDNVSTLTFQAVERGRPAREKQSDWRRWAGLLLLLLLLFLLGWLIGLIVFRQPASRGVQSAQAAMPQQAVIYEAAGWSDKALDALASHDIPAMNAALSQLPPGDVRRHNWIAERLRAALGAPDAALSTEQIPAAWQERGWTLPVEIPAPALGLDAALGMETPLDATNPVRLEIDTGDYTLKVWRDAILVAEYPVGLGADGATPLGDFRISHKIERPDWYNRGDVVPAGDPRNPLGDYWLGLAREGGPQGIGIHPTSEVGSIGGNQSRGCVRMFPEHAAEVFSLCAVGTPVAIHP